MDELVVPCIDGDMAWSTAHSIEDKNIAGFCSGGWNRLAYPDIRPGTAWQFKARSLPVYPAYEAGAIEGTRRLGTVDIGNSTILVCGVYDFPADTLFGSLGHRNGCEAKHQYKTGYAFHDNHDRGLDPASQEKRE